MGTAMQMGEGERLHDARRRRFWRILFIVGLAAVPAGFGAGFVAGRDGTDLGGFWRTIPDWLAIALVLLAVGSITIGSWRLVQSADEVEIADNLWGSTAGFYVYMLLFPSWWALFQADIASEPHDWAIFLFAFAAACGVYFVRKVRAR